MRAAPYLLEPKADGVAIDRISGVVRLIAAGESGTGTIDNILAAIVELVLASTGATNAAIACHARDLGTGRYRSLDQRASAPANRHDPELIAAILRDPQSLDATCGCFDFGPWGKVANAEHVLALRIRDSSENLTIGYARFGARPVAEAQIALQSICVLGGVLLTLLRRSWMKNKATDAVAKFDSRMRDAMRLVADAYWETDEVGIVRRIVLLDSTPESARLMALEGKALRTLIGPAFTPKSREFRDIRATVQEMGRADIAVTLSCRSDDGVWHGLARYAPDQTMGSGAEQPRSLLQQIEAARDEEATLRRETELILDGLRLLTSGKPTQEIFQQLLALFAPALEFSDAAILQRDWTGQITQTVTTLSEVETPDWQSIGEALMTLGDTASILRIPADIQLPFQDDSGQPLFQSALAVKLQYGSKPALLLGLHRRPSFFRMRHLGLGMRLALVARQAFINNEEQQKVLDASKLAAIGEMAAGIVHEINQPLTSMMLGIGNLKDKLERDGALDKDMLSTRLDRIQNEITRVTKIVASMRVLARRSDGVLTDFDVETAIQESLTLMEHKLTKASIAVSLALDGSLYARGNHLEFGQVILNLLTNAHDAIISATKPAGQARRISIAAHIAEGGWVEISVRDTGGGFSERVAENAFEPFFTTKKMGQGTGLGLALCRRIIENMGGSIAIGNWAEGAEIMLRLKCGDRPST